MKIQVIKFLSFFILFITTSVTIYAQDSYNIPDLLEKYNDKTVPYIQVGQLNDSISYYIILDTRKKAEYEVSHLPGAIWVGEKMKLKRLSKIPKDQKIVVYCSVGVRSENYGEEMLAAGFQKVYNLYGSIFQWKDAGYEIVDKYNNTTETVHVYSEKWGKYLKTGKKIF